MTVSYFEEIHISESDKFSCHPSQATPGVKEQENCVASAYESTLTDKFYLTF